MSGQTNWHKLVQVAVVIVCCELALLFVFDGIQGHFIPSHPGLSNKLGAYYGHDFLPYYATAQITLSGDPAGSYDTAKILAAEKEIVHRDLAYAPWVYPPTFLFVVLPFGLMPYVAAYIAWSFSNIMAGVLAGMTVIRRWWVGGVVILAPVSWLNVFAGQNGGFTAALMIGGLGLLNRHPIVSGILFGLISYKPQFGLIIPVALAAGRYWKCFIAAACSAIGFALAAYLTFGSSPWFQFGSLLTDALGSKGEFAGLAPALDITSENQLAIFLWLRSVTIYAMVRLAGVAPLEAALLQILSIAVVIYIVIWAWRTEKALELRAAVLALGTLLATPRAMLYDLPLLLVPTLFILARMAHTRGVTIDWFFVGFLWLCPLVGFFVFEYLNFQIWPVVFWGFMLFCIARYAGGIQEIPQAQTIK